MQGLEKVVAAEIEALPCDVRDVQYVPGKAGVFFRGPDMDTAYRACLHLRAAIRVLHHLGTEDMDPAGRGYDELYDAVQRAARWGELLDASLTVAVQLRMKSCSDWNHSATAQQCIYDAISDAVRKAGHAKVMRPDTQEAADLSVYVTMFKDTVQVFRDVSGTSLHRRGYRGVIHKASLNEAAAAGMLYTAGWPQLAKEDGALVDCMCGSGTFLVEAALMAHNIAPGLLRKDWCHHSWPDFDKQAWRDAVGSAEAACQKSWQGVIAGCDVHEGALVLAEQSTVKAGVTSSVKLRHGRCAEWHLPRAPSIVMVNPPWGGRLAADTTGASAVNGREGEHSELSAAWQDLRDFLKAECSGAANITIATLVLQLRRARNRMNERRAAREASSNLRMKASLRVPITLSGVDCRLLRYDVRSDDGGARAAPMATLDALEAGEVTARPSGKEYSLAG